MVPIYRKGTPVGVPIFVESVGRLALHNPPQLSRLGAGGNPRPRMEHLRRNGGVRVISGPMGSLDDTWTVRVFLKGHCELGARQVHDNKLADYMDFQLYHGPAILYYERNANRLERLPPMS
jgi:hypothetical protein